MFCGHVGFDGFQHISDIWAGGLVGARSGAASSAPRGRDSRDERSGSRGSTPAGRSSTAGSAISVADLGTDVSRRGAKVRQVR